MSAVIHPITIEHRPERANVSFDGLPYLFMSKKGEFVWMSVIEHGDTRSTVPIALFFDKEHADVLKRAVQAFNAVITGSLVKQEAAE
jgi:hypothetical protein